MKVFRVTLFFGSIFLLHYPSGVYCLTFNNAPILWADRRYCLITQAWTSATIFFDPCELAFKFLPPYSSEAKISPRISH